MIDLKETHCLKKYQSLVNSMDLFLPVQIATCAKMMDFLMLYFDCPPTVLRPLMPSTLRIPLLPTHSWPKIYHEAAIAALVTAFLDFIQSSLETEPSILEIISVVPRNSAFVSYIWSLYF